MRRQADSHRIDVRRGISDSVADWPTEHDLTFFNQRLTTHRRVSRSTVWQVKWTVKPLATSAAQGYPCG